MYVKKPFSQTGFFSLSVKFQAMILDLIKNLLASGLAPKPLEKNSLFSSVLRNLRVNTVCLFVCLEKKDMGFVSFCAVYTYYIN